MSKTILLTGSSGLIGSYLLGQLKYSGYEVVLSSRDPHLARKSGLFYINSFEFQNFSSMKIDAIIHTAGFYTLHDSVESNLKLIESNIGTSFGVSNIVRELGSPVISLQSYFEKCPIEFYPWSLYSASKSIGNSLITQVASKYGVSQASIYLFDNYGYSKNRKKFLDLVLETRKTNLTLKASEGKQILNLTHIDDVVSNILSVLKLIFEKKITNKEFQLKSAEEFTLREIVEIINLKGKIPINIEWGAIPNRSREVLETWDAAENIPGAIFNWTFEKYLETIL
jgi:nucleoside-diphosphate-sugar epimerase